MRELTAEEVIATQRFRRAVKTAPTKIRPITSEDLAHLGPTFLDLEGREQRVAVGRFLCIGVQGERWTCSEKSMQSRGAISDPDEEGFRWYIQREPTPVLVVLIDEPFSLTLAGSRWTSEAGVITWNGLTGDQMIMRVVEKTIFWRTYQLLTD